MTDLRAIACILDVGRQYADRLQDAPLSAALGAMCEAAVGYHAAEVRAADPYGQRQPEDREAARGVWNLAADFAALADRQGEDMTSRPRRPA